MSGPVPLVIDTDGGVDDAVGLFWAATSPTVDLRAVTVVHGNVAVGVAAANVCRVLEAAGRTDVPVAIGASAPIGPVPALRPADFIHGADGLGNTNRPPATTVVPLPGDAGEAGDSVDAVDLVAAVVGAVGGPVTLVSLGPLTNVAALVASRPATVAALGRLVTMGGVVGGPGNALPAAEANIAHDPLAAQRAVTGPWSRPPLLVGLDVTHRATLTAAELRELDAGRTPAARFLAEPLRFYAQSAGTFCAPGEFPCHDLLATVAAVRPVVRGPILPLAVQTAPGPAWGATVADRRVPFFERAGSGSTQAALPDFAPWEIGTEVEPDALRIAVRELAG